MSESTAGCLPAAISGILGSLYATYHCIVTPLTVVGGLCERRERRRRNSTDGAAGDGHPNAGNWRDPGYQSAAHGRIDPDDAYTFADSHGYPDRDSCDI